MTDDAYAGLRRRKQTPWTVKFGDAFASKLIAVGGIGTIAAIMLVVLVLLGTAWPLFQRPSQPTWRTLATPAFQHVGLDEHELIIWGADETGKITALSTASGEVLAEYPSPASDARTVTASHLSIDRTTLVLGFSDGSLQTVQLEFKTDLLNAVDLPEGIKIDPTDSVVVHAGQVYEWFDSTSVQRTQLSPPRWSEPKRLGTAAITAVDYVGSEASKMAKQSQSYVLAIVGDELALATLARKKAIVGNKVTESMSIKSCALNSRDAKAGPRAISMINGTEHALVAWSNGTLDRFNLTGEKPLLVESASGLIDGGTLTYATALLARQTLLCGDDSGRLIAWNVIREPETSDELQSNAIPSGATQGGTTPGTAVATSNRIATSDGYHLVPVHEQRISNSAIRSIASSQKHHLAAVLDSEGSTSLVFVTTNDILTRVASPLSEGVRSTAFDPGDDSLVAVSQDKVALTPLKIAHPEASFSTYFGSVWYEGYDRPQYIWQSSAGTEKAEAKLSLIPLVFGTLKATLYAMLVSVPLALMAAIYTSEFLSGAARARVKPVVELMASLPSVVLGFVAALVVAPLLQSHLMAVLVAILLVPFSFVLVGHLWNLLPLDKIVRWERIRLFALLACLPISVWMTALLSRPIERQFFQGDIVLWLNGGQGSAVGGWMLVFTPLLSCLAAFLFVGPLSERTRAIAIARTPRQFAIFSLVRLLLVSASVLLCAGLLGQFLQSLGVDARGTVFGDYQDRNAVLVGIALGFCVIPIIYTISDDALQAVPKQLRSASLGCGATPWQTTMRVVVPSAMSGLFSAIMIGLGRAVGETMVVLMAAGNTPVMDWNPFNGFRTLSATLATELPEAAKGSTHFRTLFLAALLLFVLTLIANTIAEFVRIRFRKRASQL